MPKIVDPERRRKDITDAVFRVIERDGLDSASLRNIANEAELAIGSVRHYFADHDAVMAFALRELTEQTGRRIQNHVGRLLAPSDDEDRREAVVNALAEFLPLDDERRLEVIVWLEFVTAARTRPRLSDDARRIHDGMRVILRRFLSRAKENGRLRTSRDVDVETERLAAVLDGLAMSMVLRPDRLDGEAALAALRSHVDGLIDGGDGRLRGRLASASPERRERLGEKLLALLRGAAFHHVGHVGLVRPLYGRFRGCVTVGAGGQAAPATLPGLGDLRTHRKGRTGLVSVDTPVIYELTRRGLAALGHTRRAAADTGTTDRVSTDHRLTRSFTGGRCVGLGVTRSQCGFERRSFRGKRPTA
ncbi:hypothetical protein STSO111631_10415 [Stackebrandtia soli]